MTICSDEGLPDIDDAPPRCLPATQCRRSKRCGRGPGNGDINLAPPALDAHYPLTYHCRLIDPFVLEVAIYPSRELGFYRSAIGPRAC
jgi:hypothetical protein